MSAGTPTPGEKVDQGREALTSLAAAGDAERDGATISQLHLLVDALIRAQLATVDELRGIRETLEGQAESSLDPDWQEFTGWCEKRIAREEREIAQAVVTATREAHIAARDAFVDARDRVIHGG